MSSNHPNQLPSPVGGESRNERPELIRSIPGWAQTQLGLTRVQAYMWVKKCVEIRVMLFKH